jgi:hypothetical protein
MRVATDAICRIKSHRECDRVCVVVSSVELETVESNVQSGKVEVATKLTSLRKEVDKLSSRLGVFNHRLLVPFIIFSSRSDK